MPEQAMARHRIGTKTIASIILVILCVVFFSIKYVFDEVTTTTNIAAGIFLFIAIMSVIAIDFIRDRSRQINRIIEHAETPPPVPAHLFDILNRLETRHVHHLQKILVTIQEKMAHVLKIDNNDLDVYLLARDGSELKIPAHLTTETDLDNQHLEIQNNLAGLSMEDGEIRFAIHSESNNEVETPLPGMKRPALWNVVIPVKSKAQDVYALVSIDGYAPTHSHEDYQTAVLSVLKYCFLIYNIIIEIFKVETDVQ